MVIDVNLLARQGKESEELFFEFPIKEELILSPEMKISKGQFKGEIILGEKIYVQGVITFIVSGDCSRCLEPANNQVDVNVEEVYSQRPQDEEYGYKSGRVDLTEMLNDKILSNQPSILLCDINCKGLCPKCGCNLNFENCNCEK